MSDWTPYEDDQCITDFVEANSNDFYLWLAEKGVHHDYACDYEMSYCESRAQSFEEFGHNWLADYLEARAEKDRELKEDR